MNSTQLFSRRLRQNWKYQYDIFNVITDWTVMLYILIPSSVIIISVYISWWDEIPQWIEHVPLSYLFVFFFLFIWGGHFRTYSRDADRVFLIKNRTLHLGLKQKGIVYTYLFQLLPTAILGFIVAPFWLNYYQIGFDQFILYLALFLSSKWLIMGVKGKLNANSKRWWNIFKSVPMFVGVVIIWLIYYHAFQNDQTILMIELVIFNVLASGFLVKIRFTSVKTFEQDLSIDEAEKNKYLNLIFGISLDIDKPSKPVSSRKSPLLYSKSNRLFKKRTSKNGFLELFIKVTTRNSDYFLRYFQIIGVTSLAIVLIPSFWIKSIIVIFGFYFIRIWIRDNWDNIIRNHSFTMKYADLDAYFKGRKIATNVFSIGLLILVSLTYLTRIWISSLM